MKPEKTRQADPTIRAATANAGIIRRFFDLIERFESGKRGIETKSAPRPKLRIRRLDDLSTKR